MSDKEWAEKSGEWLPNQEDEVFIKGLMQPVVEPGKIANWIAPPRRGINNNDFDFTYVKRN